MNFSDIFFIVGTGLLYCVSVILIGGTLLAILMAVRYSIAFVFYPRKRGHGKITKKTWTAAYSTVVGMGYPVWIPASYGLYIGVKDNAVGEQKPEVSVNYAMYSSVKQGSKVSVLYSIEPFTRKVYIWKFWI